MRLKQLLYLAAGVVAGAWLVRWAERGFTEDEYGRPR